MASVGICGVCAGVRGCARVCAAHAGLVRGYAQVYVDVCVIVSGCTRVCVGVCRCAQLCGMNFQNFFWRIES